MRASRIGDIADAVYFILRGTISITDAKSNLLTVLSTGSHFGEFGLLAYLDGEVGEWSGWATRPRSDGCIGRARLELEPMACSFVFAARHASVLMVASSLFLFTIF